MHRLLAPFALTVILFSALSPVRAQETLTLEQAVSIGLERNYTINIARNSSAVAENNTVRGTAGFLPRLDGAGSAQYADSRQTTNSPFSFGNSQTKTLSANLSLDWTLFDGFKMFAEKDRYEALARLGAEEARYTIENTVLAIMEAYLNVVQQDLLLDVARETQLISRTRLEREQTRRELGGVTLSEVVNAQVALNNDSAEAIRQELQASLARNRLNLLLGRNPAFSFSVDTVIAITPVQSALEELHTRAEERNAQLRVARASLDAAKAAQTTARSAWLPSLALGGDYGYTDRTVAAASRPADVITKSVDASVSLNLSMNLFNGFRDKIEAENAELEKRSRELALNDARNALRSLVDEKHRSFVTRLQLVRLEESTRDAAKMNLDLIRERYETGTTGSLEFRDAQLNYARARLSLVNARYLARIAQMELEQLIGSIRIE